MHKISLPVFLLVMLTLQFPTSFGWSQNRPGLTILTQDFHGVQRVVVGTASGNPVANDIAFQVVINVIDFRRVPDNIIVDAMLAKGEASVTVDVPVLQSKSGWTSYKILVEQDGNRSFDPNKDWILTEHQPTIGWYQGDWQLFVSSNIVSTESHQFSVGKLGQSTPNMLGVGVEKPETLPSFAASSDIYTDKNLISPSTISSDLSVLQSASIPLHSLHPADFFESWKSLHGYSSVLISFDDLKTIAQSPSKLDALRKWVSIGGELIVFNVGKQYKEQFAVLKILGKKPEEVAWLEPDSTRTSKQAGARAATIRAGNANVSRLAVGSFRAARKLDQQLFVKSRLLLGNVFLIPDGMTTWQANDWDELYSSLGWTEGVSSKIGKNSLARHFMQEFSIPGVSEPPVLAFQFLIGLFVLVIGPLTYFLCQRSGRPYLLLVTTPLFALFSVVLLFAYGILIDGFDWKGRAQSVTFVDHSLQLGLTHARQAFYCGTSPGICQFPADVLAMDTQTRFSSQAEFLFRDQRQSVSGGQIRARTPFQFTSLQCFSSDRQLSLLGTGGGAVATNGFDSKIRLAVFKKEDQWLIARDIPAQGSVPTEKANFQEAQNRIGQLLGTEMVKNASATSYLRLNTGYGVIASDQWGLCHSTANAIAHPDSLRGIFATADYIAIAERSWNMPEPLPDVVYDGRQLHIIIGSW